MRSTRQGMKCLVGAAVLSLMLGGGGPAWARPLKVFILAGQSNMQGHVNISTFDSMAGDPRTAPLLKEMRNADGTPVVCQNVWISSIGCAGDDTTEQTGHLTAGFGASPNEIGPEFTFGITMEKLLHEPILIIKTSWGGKSLNTDFRPPSAGPYPFSEAQLADFKRRGADIEKIKADKAKETGVYYRLMIEHVHRVLKDIKRVCPVYDEKAGYELAGFVWFQGWNDMVDGDTYPDRDKPGGYDTYSDLLATFIRDVRKDLNAPRMPFVIGVLGVGGVNDQVIFRKAMAAPAALPEFKGSVAAVETAPFWDNAMAAAQPKQAEYNRIIDTAHALNKDGAIDKHSKWEAFWKPIGQPLPQDRTWRYMSIDPREEKDRLREYTDRRFRDITLPAELEQWSMPNFDDSRWKQGKAPIGKGVWNNSGITLEKYPSAWGAGEFLLMRTTFEVKELNYAAYRIAILARQGFNVYLNGHKIQTYIWWNDRPYYRAIVLGNEETRYLKTGVNVLAAYANDQYGKGSTEHYGATDLWLEGITRPEKEKLDSALEEVLPLKDREILKGASNGDYHYMGAAKIMAPIGQAFAEAMANFQQSRRRR
ncbi:MAG TPA: sialate O-acetylesterase [Armatimonadota bacterium]|nr:sialate O-acetylesterase [Armatimonadota bacterium]